MKFYNYSIYIFLFIFSTTSLRAQDVTITDTDIILDQNNNIIPGQIIFDFDEGTFDMHIYQLTALSYPVGSGCAPVYNEQVIDDDDFTINIGSLFGEICAGEYCWLLVQDPGTPDECEIEFCVYINYCEMVLMKGRWVKACTAISPGPGTGTGLIVNENQDEIHMVEVREEVTDIDQSALTEEPIISNFNILNIYPVPFKEAINIKFETSQDKSINIRLFDLYGRLLQNDLQQIEAGVNILTLTTPQNLPEGIYLLQITDENGHQVSKQISHFN